MHSISVLKNPSSAYVFSNLISLICPKRETDGYRLTMSTNEILVYRLFIASNDEMAYSTAIENLKVALVVRGDRTTKLMAECSWEGYRLKFRAIEALGGDCDINESYHGHLGMIRKVVKHCININQKD